MTVLSATASTKLIVSYAGAPDIGSVIQTANDQADTSFTDGSGANQAQKYWADTRTIAASGSENLDLAGVLADIFGSVLTLTKIKVLRIRAAAGNTNNVVIGGHATAAWLGPFGDVTDTLAIKPGGELLLIAPDAAGYGVTATTGDMLKVANSGGTTGVTYTIEIVAV